MKLTDTQVPNEQTNGKAQEIQEEEKAQGDEGALRGLVSSDQAKNEKVASRSRRFFRIDFEHEEESKKKHAEANLAAQVEKQEEGKEKLIQYIHDSIIGDNEVFKSPFGYRKVTYCDYVASARSLSFIEEYIRKEVLTMYANTHTTTSITGRQSTMFRYEAREIIMNAVHPSKFDRLVFTGSGATSAINKLIHIMGLKNEIPNRKPTVVFVGPFEHHSNLLPWRECGANVVNIDEDDSGYVNQTHLKQQLQYYSAQNPKPLMIGAFSAASNVTGIISDTIAITALLHKYGALAIWDYACAAPYVQIDMNPVVEGISRDLVAKDAIIISPHKFIGGVETPGVLICKKKMFINKVPENPGGGTVFFVTDNDHRYLKKQYEREEGGTPSIVGSVRCGLVFQLKSAVGEELIEKREKYYCMKAIQQLRQIQNVVILGNLEAERLAIFSFLIKHNNSYLHYNYVSVLLNDLFGIQVRGGCACAGPYAQRLLGLDNETSKTFEKHLLADDDYEFLRPGFVRLNFNYFIDEETFQFIIDAIRFVAKQGWKLMPYYTFYPETGEWVHNMNKKFTTRRWLHNISYKNNKMEYRHLINMKVTTKEYKKYLNEAEKIIQEANQEFTEKKSFVVPDQTNLLPQDINKLRWFIYPCEALSELRGDLSSQTQLTCPINPKKYTTSSLEAPMTSLLLSSDASTKTQRTTQTTTQSRTNDIQSKMDIENSTKKDEQVIEAKIMPSNKQKEESIDLSFGLCDEEESKILEQNIDHKIASANKRKNILWPKCDKKMISLTKKAVFEFGMLKDGDRVMLGLSGGKDSLTMLHVLHHFQRSLNIKFDLAACTIDPQTDAYDPAPLKNYMKSLGIPYYFESQNIIEVAKDCQATSICSWCSRMKRGILYNALRRERYNVLVLAQHLDDLAESFVMSTFFNGYLRTQKVNYTIDAGDIRVIRPFMYVRERDIKKWARENHLPIINENCPACFELPKERARMKTLLSSQEHLYPNLFYSLSSAMRPLVEKDIEKVKGSNKKFKTAHHNIYLNKTSEEETQQTHSNHSAHSKNSTRSIGNNFVLICGMLVIAIMILLMM